jgi:hypothetical protein
VRALDLSRAVLEALCRLLGLRRSILLSFVLEVPRQKTERLIAICRALGADRYLTGDAASDYPDETQFAAHGIRVEYHHYRHPVYAQRHGAFVPYLSVVDLLMNHGRESLRVLVDGDAHTAEELRR